MVELYCKGGVVYTDIALTYEAIAHIMTNDVVQDNDFLEFHFTDGTRGAVRKKNIDGFF